MRFAFATIPTGPPAETVGLIRFAERLNFDVAWMPDQTFHRDPFVTLAACALGTERITLGVGVTNPYTRHPAVTARAAATLSELSGGRFVLGIGAGNRKELIDLLGLPSDRAGARCREAAVTIKRLLAGERVTHRSSTLVIDGVELEVGRTPLTPIYLAARGPQILQAAGEVADGVIIGALVSEAGLGFALSHVRSGTGRAGRSLDDIEVVSWVTTIVTDDRDGVIDRLRPTVAHIVGGAPVEVLDAIGLSKARIHEFKQAYAQGGPGAAAPLVDPGLTDLLTIVGSAPAVAERLDALAAAGVSQLAVLMPGGRGGSHAFPGFDHQGNLRLLAEEVLPKLQSTRDRSQELQVERGTS